MCDGGVCLCVCVSRVCVCMCVCDSEVCVCVCVCDGGRCGAGRAGGVSGSHFYFGEKEQSGARRQGFLWVSLVPQRLRKNWPTVDS